MGARRAAPRGGEHQRLAGEALVAHVKATMKDEDPRYFCFEPRDARKIPLDVPGADGKEKHDGSKD